mmetsp:Transcript_6179/g.10321  ORF Transcript_6179/g.10321 Transcript_6179/m.10321 type:complete len:334 (-) Transcript_6179:38-1039(-)
MSEQNTTGAEEETFFQEADNKNPDDSFIALVILGVAVVIVLGVGLYLWRNNKSGPDNSWKQTSFSPPPERAAYLEAKEKLDPVNNVSDLDELKKLLMRRAIQTIPILLSLQNEGTSIERLYKRGMLTDDMHFKVKELKAFVDQEFQDIQFAADELLEGWGQHIWPQAMQFHQMIQKQADAKSEEQKAAEEEKRKSDASKKREKEKAKKLAKQQQTSGGASSSVNSGSSSSGSGSSSSGSTSSSSGGGGGGSGGAGGPNMGTPTITPTASTTTTGAATTGTAAATGDSSSGIPDGEAAKAAEAERMAQQLLAEEERERKKNSSASKGAKKGGKK